MSESIDQDCYKWTEEDISNLIQIRYERREDFKTPGVRPKDVWLKIVLDLHLEKQITADECSEQWSHLLMKFKEMECKMSDGSCSKELEWPHYNQMQSVIMNLEAYEDSMKSTINVDDLNVQYSKLNCNGFTEQRSNRRDRKNEIDERFARAIEESNRHFQTRQSTIERQGQRFHDLMQRFFTNFDLTENQDMFDVTRPRYPTEYIWKLIFED